MSLARRPVRLATLPAPAPTVNMSTRHGSTCQRGTKVRLQTRPNAAGFSDPNPSAGARLARGQAVAAGLLEIRRRFRRTAPRRMSSGS